jgi:acetoin utilization protein AcuB
MLVTDYMSRPVLTAQPQTEFHLAHELMRHRDIHHLPVVESGRIVGIVAERDLLLAAAHFGSAHVPLSEIMRGPVECVSVRATLMSAARKLVVRRIGSLPVVDGKKQLVGIITETDIFKAMAEMAWLTKRAGRKAPAPARRKPAKRTRKAAAKRRKA